MFKCQQNSLKQGVEEFAHIDELFNSVFYMEDLPGSGRNRSLYLSIRRLVKQIVVIIVPRHVSQLFTKFYLASCCQGVLHMQRKYWCGFQRNRSTTDHIFCIHQILEKKLEYSEAVHQLFIDFTKTDD